MNKPSINLTEIKLPGPGEYYMPDQVRCGHKKSIDLSINSLIDGMSQQGVLHLTCDRKTGHKKKHHNKNTDIRWDDSGRIFYDALAD